jgi:hypothetical protein
MTDDETIALHVTMIGGRPYPNDFTVFWRGVPIGRIMKVRARHWWWGCNVDDRPSLDGDKDLDDCKAKFSQREAERVSKRKTETTECETAQEDFWKNYKRLKAEHLASEAAKSDNK